MSKRKTKNGPTSAFPSNAVMREETADAMKSATPAIREHNEIRLRQLSRGQLIRYYRFWVLDEEDALTDDAPNL